MALVTPTLRDGLIAAEDPPAATSAVAAQRFGDVFANYFKTAQTTTPPGVPVNPATCELPTAKQALVGGLTGAFSASGGPTVADLIGVSILAYINAGPVSLFFTGALSATIIAPLSVYMAGISSPVPEQIPAKTAVALAIKGWLGSGLQLSFPSEVKAFII